MTERETLKNCMILSESFNAARRSTRIKEDAEDANVADIIKDDDETVGLSKFVKADLSDLGVDDTNSEVGAEFNADGDVSAMQIIVYGEPAELDKVYDVLMKHFEEVAADTKESVGHVHRFTAYKPRMKG